MSASAAARPPTVADRVRALHASTLASRPAPAKPEPSRNGYRHADVIDANTGWRLDPADWAERQRASRLLQEQTDRLADALERKGVRVRADSDVVLVGAVSGQVEELAAYRACRFLPSVAARDRRPILQGMRYFMQEHPAARYFRYQVFTCAEPVPVFGDLRKAVQGLSRRISKWAAEVARERDVEVLFRGIEWTRATAAERGMADRFPPETVLYHVHANVIAWPKRAMARAEWGEFLQSTWRAVKAQWRDNGSVSDPAELIKYVLKPGDLDDAQDDEILWLYEESRRLKLVQPMGPFAAFLAELDEKGEKVVRVRTKDGRTRLVRSVKSTRLDHAKRETREDASSGSPPSNLLLGITLPQWRWTPWAEPMLIVQRYEPGAVGTAARERLDEIDAERTAARAVWDRSGAPEPATALEIAREYAGGVVTAFRRRSSPAGEQPASYSVHTCSSTVRRGAAGCGATCPPPSQAGAAEGREGSGPPPIDPVLGAILATFPGAEVHRVDRG